MEPVDSNNPDALPVLPVIAYEPAGDYSDAPIATPPNGLAALVWAIAAAALTPYFCLSFPLGAIAVMAAVWTLHQPKHAKRAYRRCAVAALVIVALAVVGLLAVLARFL